MKRLTIFLLLALAAFNGSAQYENRIWYFGDGTDGLKFTGGSQPVRVTDKHPGVGFEGMIVVTDPVTGNLLFYSDGDRVIDHNHAVMNNGTGLTGHNSGTQCVQATRVPGECKKYYLFTNSGWDAATGKISYSIVDFSSGTGVVTGKNTPLWAGPTDQAMCVVSRPNSNDYWLIANTSNTATYNVFAITASGISAPAVYQFSNTGKAYYIRYNSANKKLTVAGTGNKYLTLLDFNPVTGALSNETRLVPPFTTPYGGPHCFSPDCSKLYISLEPPQNLVQYDFTTATWTSMNTCCYAHDLKMGPDGKMYHVHTYNSNQPMAVIDYPDRPAAGNQCGYRTLTFFPRFNGESRIFPEFVTLPDPLAANKDTITIYSAAAIDISVLDNDQDPQSDPVSIDSIIAAPKKGQAVISGNKIRYTPSAMACSGTDTLVYRAKDNTCQFDTALIVIFYRISTQAVTANADWLPITSSSPVDIDVLANDLPGTSSSVDSIVRMPGKGTATIVQNKIRYVPASSCNYTDTLIYRLQGGCLPDTALVIISYTNPTEPVADPDRYRLASAAGILADVLANDQGTGLQIDAIVRPPARGTAQVFLNQILYTPNAQCQPADTLIYQITPGACPGDTALVIIEGDTNVPFSITTNAPVCEGQKLDLHATAFPGAVYSWTGPGAMQFFRQDTTISNAQPGHSGTYTLTATANSCPPQPVAVYVAVNPLPVVNLGTDTSACDSIYFSVPFLEKVSYRWSTGDSATALYAATSGSVHVFVTDSNGCQGSDTVQVIIYPRPVIGMDSLISVCVPDTLIGPRNTFAAYLWNNGSSLPQIRATSYGLYTVTVTDRNGCTAVGAVEIKDNCAPNVIVPNIFTPNGDGLNDVFYPEIVNISELHLEIYNRWGTLVFRSDELYKGWDGTSADTPCAESVYVYLIRGITNKGAVKQLKGLVTLLR